MRYCILIFQSEHARLVSGNHVLNVDVRVFAPMLLKLLQSLLNQVANVVVLFLVVVYFVSNIQVSVPEKIKDWENLSVVRHQTFCDCI